MDLSTIILAGIAFVIVWLLFSAIKIVREYERLVVLRLGAFLDVRGPGPTLIVPIIDKAIKVDLRESYFEVPHQTCITKDNAPTDIDFVVYYKVVKPAESVLAVQNFKGAAIVIATTTLRDVIGNIVLDDVLAKRDEINKILRTKLDEVTERWGVKVTSVEIREILPPRDVQEAMIKQMAAERNRRAMVTEAEGKKISAIKVAEGKKQATILEAEGDRQAAILRAEGFARALEQIYNVANRIDVKTMTLQYLKTLEAIGSSPATKIILPMEFTRLLQPLIGYAEKSMGQK